MTEISKKKKCRLRKRNAQSKYSTSLSPDIRRKGSRGTPIANPTCDTHNDSSRPTAKKRHWNNIDGNRSRNRQAHQKQSLQHSNTVTNQHSNEHDSRKSNQPQQKKRRRSRNLNPANSTAKPVTRSQTRRLSEEQQAISRDTLMVPKKHHILDRSAASYTSLASVQGDEEETVASKDTECPYCLATISLADSKILLNAYNDIKQKDKVYHGQPSLHQITSDDLKQQEQHDPKQPITPEQLNRSTLSSIYIPTPYQNLPERSTHRPVPLMERYSFCQLHNIELVVKPRGIKLGWPAAGLFEDLKDRILRFKDELDMVIAKKLSSSYREMAVDAYKEMGQHKARSTMGRMATFEAFLPGYYGIKGASIIQESLAQMYLHKGKLGNNVTAPQSSIEYLQQVLIPEVGFRLIREDMIKKDSSKRNDPDIDNQAKSVMCESASFGSYLHPLDWHDSISDDE